MTIHNISGDVRIVSYGSLQAFTSDDIVVEEQRDGLWRRVMSFNSMSNDWAHSESRDYAHHLARQRLQEIQA